MGLDWTPCGGCTEATWLRIHSFGGPAVQTWVAKAVSYNTGIVGCPYAVGTDLRRTSGAGVLYGRVINLHSNVLSSNPINIYSRQAGWQSSGIIGTFVNQADDPCSSYNHTMQWYESGLWDINSSKNTSASIPTEAQCRGPGSCNISFPAWSIYEYAFTFDPTPDTLPTGGVLQPTAMQDDRLTSDDGRFVAIMQTAGNFVVYRNSPWTALWASNWCGQTELGNMYGIMQSAGNFVVYPTAGGLAKWATNWPQANPACISQSVLGAGVYMVMQNDGNLVMYLPGYGAVWHSNTCCY